MARFLLAIDWTSGLDTAWTSVASCVPKLLVFLVVLLIAWIVAKAVSKVVGAVLEKVGFDRLLDRAGLNQFLDKTSFTPIGLITKLLYYFILLIGLQLALSAFGPTNPVSQIVNDIVAWLPKAIVAIVIVVIAAAIANVVKELIGGALASVSYGKILTNIVGAFIVALGVIAALNQVGIGTTVTMPVLTAVLATVAGILIVGVDGGLIGPMRERWEGWLQQLAADTQAVKGSDSSGTAPQAGTEPAGTDPASTDPARTGPQQQGAVYDNQRAEDGSPTS